MRLNFLYPLYFFEIHDYHQLNDEKLNSSLSEYENNKIEFDKNKLNKAKLLLEKGIAIIRDNRKVNNQDSMSPIEESAHMGLAESQVLLSQIIFLNFLLILTKFFSSFKNDIFNLFHSQQINKTA